MPTRNNIFIFLAVFLCYFWASIKGSDAATIYASSASFSDVSAAVASATYGDTVNVPAGSANWGNNKLTIAKGIKLVGAGINQTVITFGHSTGSGITYTPDSTSLANNTPFEISGFTFDCTGCPNPETTYLMITVNNNSTTTTITNVKIHDNKFSNMHDTAIMVRCPAVYGVAYSNQFVDVGIPFRAIGYNYKSWDYWYNNFGYGNGNNFFFEDNTISFVSLYQATWGFIEVGQGGSTVVRYNTWDLANQRNNALFDMLDIHGNQGSNSDPTLNNWAGIGAEWYGNKVYNDNKPPGYNSRLISLRGGRNLVFYNDWTHAPGISVYASTWDVDAEDRKDSYVTRHYCPGLPLGSCTECGIKPQHITNTYYWRNLHNGSEIELKETADGCNVVNENSEYFKYNASFDGSTGIGCGTLASRPATCTTGVAYWATNQSCSNLTGMVGKNPGTAISGTLYKCTATNTWTPYYTPYTYPHPLRQEIGTNTANSPNPPTGLKIVQ